MKLSTDTLLQISRDELTTQLAEILTTVIIDVLPEAEFKAAHLPGALNACVFDMTFLDDVKKLVPDPATPLVLYGSSARNLASQTAAEKLAAAGYAHLANYRGGLEDWREAGHAVEGDGATPVPKPQDGTHQIDVEQSKVGWTGRNLTGAHSGTIKLRGGSIKIESGKPVSGSFTLDMRDIECTDLKDGKLREMLEAHLKAEDFFDVERYPRRCPTLHSVTQTFKSLVTSL
jgi:rhodanese-related sulfurtransferase